MTQATASALVELAEKLEAGHADDRALNREVALATGWHRYSPREIGKSNPGWIAPEDFIGETVGKDGRRSPILDSLHGTDIWREPRNYLGSIDAAMSLVPEGFMWRVQSWPDGVNEAILEKNAGDFGAIDARHTGTFAATPALALTAAALRARALQSQDHTNAE